MVSVYDRAVTVYIDGTELSQEEYRLGNVVLRQSLDDHHTFSVEVLAVAGSDQLNAFGRNSVLNDLYKRMGAKIEIEGSHGYLGSDRSDKVNFSGVVTAVEAFTHVEHGYAVRLRGHSPSIRLDDVPRNRVYRDVTVSDVVKMAAGERGLDAGEIRGGAFKHTMIYQRGETDWEFARRRLAQEGFVLYYDGAKIKGVDKFADSVGKLGFGEGNVGLIEFSVEAHARPGSVDYAVWDPEGPAKTLKQSSASTKPTAKAAHPFAKAAEKASGQIFNISGNAEPVSAVPNQKGLDDDARAARGSWIRSLTTGRGRSDLASLAPGKVFELTGFESDLNGKFVVTSVVHEWSDERLVYTNAFECVPEESIAAVHAPRRAETGGIWTARVVSRKDPDNEGKVEVQFVNHADGESAWARLSSHYLDDEGGIFFFPEIGDEVIVAFTDGDPRYPVILGSVPKPTKPSKAFDAVSGSLADKNDHKVIRTRGGHTLLFDETQDKQKIRLFTPKDECLLELDATKGEEKIVIRTKGDVEVVAEKNCSVTAKQDVTVKAEGGMKLDAQKDISIESAANLKLKAAQNVSIEGMEVESKGKGGSVKAHVAGVDVKGTPFIKLN